MNTPGKLFPSLLITATLLASCANEPEDKRDRMEDRMENIHDDMRDVDQRDRGTFESDRQEILGDLRDLREDINDDLSDTEEQLAQEDLDPADEQRHLRLRNELQRQRDIVDIHLEKVENADIQNWEQVNVQVRNTMENSRLLYDREGLERRRPGKGSPLDLNRNAQEVR